MGRVVTSFVAAMLMATAATAETQQAVFGMGCFWCVAHQQCPAHPVRGHACVDISRNNDRHFRCASRFRVYISSIAEMFARGFVSSGRIAMLPPLLHHHVSSFIYIYHLSCIVH